jgi:hypothetical protein
MPYEEGKRPVLWPEFIGRWQKTLEFTLFIE